MKNSLYLLLLLGCPAVCGQAPVAASDVAFRIPKDSAVLVLPVSIRFEDIYTDAPLDPAAYKGPETARTFDSLSQMNLSAAGIRIVPASPDDSVQDSLMAASKQLLRPVVPAAWRPLLVRAARAAGCRYVLVCSFRVKVGPGGFWDPSSGAIGASSTYGRMHAALLDPHAEDGKPCWTQDVEIRKLPRPDSGRFSEAVQLLFQRLN